MVPKYLILYCFVLVLCLRQSVSLLHNCDKICARWEGIKDAKNVICRRRYLLCLEEEMYPKAGRANFQNIGPHLLKTLLMRSDEPCVDVETKWEIDFTMCREVCHAVRNEKQIEVPLESCRPDTYCCKLPEPEFPTEFDRRLYKDSKRRKEPHSWKSVYRAMGWE